MRVVFVEMYLTFNIIVGAEFKSDDERLDRDQESLLKGKLIKFFVGKYAMWCNVEFERI